MPDMKKKLDRFTAAILAQATQETSAPWTTCAAAGTRPTPPRRIRSSGRPISTSTGRSPASNPSPDAASPSTCWTISASSICAGNRWPRRRSRWSGRRSRPLRKRPPICPACGPCWTRPWPPCPAARRYRSFWRAEDLPLAQPLQASCGGARRLTFREGGFQLGGLVAESEQLGLRVDSSFDSAAGELSGHFAELFGISLSDDDSPEGGNAQ